MHMLTNICTCMSERRESEKNKREKKKIAGVAVHKNEAFAYGKKVFNLPFGTNEAFHFILFYLFFNLK